MYEVVNWIHLRQNMGKWYALVNKVMVHIIAYKAGNFLASSVTVNFIKKGCTLMELNYWNEIMDTRV